MIFNPFSAPEEHLLVDDQIDPNQHFFQQQSQILNNCEYFLEDKFNNISAELLSHTNFSMLHLNLRSLDLHFHELQYYLSLLNSKFSVIALTETWLNDKKNLN